MEVFLTGATGYIGSVVAEALQKAGHKVTGLARTPEKAKLNLESRGIRATVGDLLKPETIAAPARSADGVIHTANTNDANSPQADAVVVRAILKSLEGTGKPFVYTSGVWVLRIDRGQNRGRDDAAECPRRLWRNVRPSSRK